AAFARISSQVLIDVLQRVWAAVYLGFPSTASSCSCSCLQEMIRSCKRRIRRRASPIDVSLMEVNFSIHCLCTLVSSASSFLLQVWISFFQPVCLTCTTSGLADRE